MKYNEVFDVKLHYMQKTPKTSRQGTNPLFSTNLTGRMRLAAVSFLDKIHCLYVFLCLFFVSLCL
jgi:hypothetical protein